jgi:phosphoserine phosphatase
MAKENLILRGSVGVGDTESDIAFLKFVSRPICFNPNKKLYDHARRAGWEVVVERKDVIYQRNSI